MLMYTDTNTLPGNKIKLEVKSHTRETGPNITMVFEKKLTKKFKPYLDFPKMIQSVKKGRRRREGKREGRRREGKRRREGRKEEEGKVEEEEGKKGGGVRKAGKRGV